MRLSLKPHFVCFLFLAASASGLRAQDFFGAGVSAQTAARAGIFSPSVDNALDALASNPAGLAALNAPVANLSALGLLARGSFSNSANHDSPMPFNGGAIPYGAFGAPLGTRWAVAFGILPDLISSARWNYTDAPGTAGASYGTTQELSRLVALRATAGVSYRLTGRIAVGMTFSGVYNSNTLVAPYIFQSNPELKGLKTLVDLRTSGWGANTGFGTTIQISRRWQIAAAWRGKTGLSSTGNLNGTLGAQFAALNIPFPPQYSYHAQASIQLPQSANVTAAWQTTSRLRLLLGSSWTNWHSSFATLPITLTNGSNASINAFLNSASIKDTVPVDWKNQYTFRAAVERQFTEACSVSAGFSHQNDPVPSSTLSPLTAAIMGNSLSAGIGFHLGRTHFEAAYHYILTAAQNVATSTLLSGEFNNSQVRVGAQGLTLTATFHR